MVVKVNQLNVGVQEDAIAELVGKSELSQDDKNLIGYLLSGILTEYFSRTRKDLGLRSWCIEDMYPDTVHRTKKKLNLTGDIHWLGGGGECKRYQADISTNTSPMLYSFKLQNKHGHQILYIGKTFKGWILNATLQYRIGQ